MKTWSFFPSSFSILFCFSQCLRTRTLDGRSQSHRGRSVFILRALATGFLDNSFSILGSSASLGQSASAFSPDFPLSSCRYRGVHCAGSMPIGFRLGPLPPCSVSFFLNFFGAYLRFLNLQQTGSVLAAPPSLVSLPPIQAAFSAAPRLSSRTTFGDSRPGSLFTFTPRLGL